MLCFSFKTDLFEAYFLMHGGFPPSSITQNGLTTGKSVHGEPKSKAGERMYTNSISTCSC